MALATNNGRADAGPEVARDDLRRGRAEMRSLGARTAEITAEIRELARLEAELAKAEMQENRGRLMAGSMNGAAAGALAFWILGFLGAAMTLGLMEIWPGWAAALATAGTFLLIATIAGLMARRHFKKFSPTPERTIASLREDARWARQLMKQSAESANSGR